MKVRTKGAYFAAASDYLAPQPRKKPAGYNLVSDPEIAIAARLTMGQIDLDPMSSEVANTVVQAEKIFTEEDDGLGQTWNGRVYLYPPRQPKTCIQAVRRLHVYWEAGAIQQAVLFSDRIDLLRACPWLHDFPICWLYNLPKLMRETGRSLEPLENFRSEVWGFVAFFPDMNLWEVSQERFCSAFRSLGRVTGVECFSWKDDWREALDA